MADISKCSGENCQVRDKCYRYLAISNPYRQAWSNYQTKEHSFTPEKGCDEFWDRTPEKGVMT